MRYSKIHLILSRHRTTYKFPSNVCQDSTKEMKRMEEDYVMISSPRFDLSSNEDGQTIQESQSHDVDDSSLTDSNPHHQAQIGAEIAWKRKECLLLLKLNLKTRGRRGLILTFPLDSRICTSETSSQEE